MNRHHVTRRMALGAALVMMVSLGAVSDASAAPRSDYGSRETMKLECELLGGTFIDYGEGNLFCAHAGGTIICDNNGKDCHTDSQAKPGAPRGPHAGTIDDMPIEVKGAANTAPSGESTLPVQAPVQKAAP